MMRLQTTVDPADVAAYALRVCPMASGFDDHVTMIETYSRNGYSCKRVGVRTMPQSPQLLMSV